LPIVAAWPPTPDQAVAQEIQARRRVGALRGRTEVVDADLSDYFSSIPHGPRNRQESFIRTRQGGPSRGCNILHLHGNKNRHVCLVRPAFPLAPERRQLNTRLSETPCRAADPASETINRPRTWLWWLLDGPTNAGRLRGDGDDQERAGSEHRRQRHQGSGSIHRWTVPGGRLRRHLILSRMTRDPRSIFATEPAFVRRLTAVAPRTCVEAAADRSASNRVPSG
jgi:hypothetical protein